MEVGIAKNVCNILRVGEILAELNKKTIAYLLTV